MFKREEKYSFREKIVKKILNKRLFQRGTCSYKTSGEIGRVTSQFAEKSLTPVHSVPSVQTSGVPASWILLEESILFSAIVCPIIVIKGSFKRT